MGAGTRHFWRSIVRGWAAEVIRVFLFVVRCFFLSIFCCAFMGMCSIVEVMGRCDGSWGWRFDPSCKWG